MNDKIHKALGIFLDAMPVCGKFLTATISK